MEKGLKVYSLVGRKLVECEPDELKDKPVGMIVDEKEEMIRLVITPVARKKQRETLMESTADFNMKEYAGTYLVSHLENPEIVNNFLDEIKKGEGKEPEPEPVKKKKKRRKKKGAEEVVEVETSIMERWDPEAVKRVVNFLDGKPHASLVEIQEVIGLTEGESYYLTQDLIYIGTLPGRWVGYDDGQWYYQVITDQPLSKLTPKKTKATKKKSTPAASKTKATPKKKTTTTKKSTTKKTTTKK
ncbi:MAG: hypothetical protein KAQ95_02450 [Candidatus Heimdallarchaeota archaeon]|nr:hypothetical protein [Candidatus Heimdallarchaeota archaeon]